MAVAVLGAVAIVTKADVRVLLALDFNDGDLLVLVVVLVWALYSVLPRFRPQRLHPLAFLAAVTVPGHVLIARSTPSRSLRAPLSRRSGATSS